MNNIYKVIWSKAKNCYVVASEIARSHTKSASGSEKIGGVTRRSLLASLMALSLLCGGLGVASAADVVHVDENATGAAEVYTKTGVDTLLDKKADKTAVEEIKNTVGGVDSGLVKKTADNANGIEVNRTNINTLKDTVGDDTKGLTKKINDNTAAIAMKADTAAVTTLEGRVGDVEGKVTTLEGKVGEASSGLVKDVATLKTTVGDASSGLVKDVATLKTTVGDASSGLVKDVADLKTQGNDLNTAIGNKADQSDLDAAKAKITTNETNITALQTKTTGLSADGKSLNSMNRVETDALKVTGEISNGAGVTITLAKIDESMKQTETNKGDIANLKSKTDTQQTWIGKLNERTTQISYDPAKGTTVNGVDFMAAEVDAHGKGLTGVTTLNTTGAATIGGALKADSLIVENASNLKGDVTMDNKLSVTGDTTLGALNVTGESSLKDTQVNGTLTTTGKATFKEAVEMDKGLTVTSGDTTLQNTDVKGALNVTGESNLKNTTVGGTLGVTGEATFKDKVTMDKTLSVTGDTTLKGTKVDGKLTVTDEADLKNTTVGGTLGVTGEATFKDKVTMEKDLEVKGELKTDKIAMENKKTDADGRHNSSTAITADYITHIGEVENNGVITKSSFTHNEKGTINYAKDGDTADWKETRSYVTASGVSNKMTDSDKNKHTYSQTATESKEQLVNGDKSKSNFEKKTAEGNTISITEKDAAGNPKSYLTNTQTVDGEKTSVTNKDSSSTINQGADQIRYNVTSKDENKTSSSIEVKADGITNTSKDGTITNDANHIENTANTMNTTVTGQATESYGKLDTTVNGEEKHTVNGKQTNTVKEGQINNITGGQTNTITGGQINNITGDQTTTITGNKNETVTENVKEDYKKDLTTTVGGNETHEVKGTKTETVEGKVTENYKAGQATNVTGDQDITVSGTQTTKATDIKRNASSGMIDTIDNDYGTNTETKVAGETKTEVSIKGTGEKGEYIRGATESRDYIINGTLENKETKTAEATTSKVTDGTLKNTEMKTAKETSSEVTDGNGKTSATIQDVTQISGSVTDGTNTSVSNVKANSIDSIVTGEGMSSVINQKKGSIQSTVVDGTSSTVILQDKDNVTIASSNGMVGIVGKDIVNNAQNTITNTAGTKITDKVGTNTRVTTSTSITDSVGATTNRKIEDGKITDTAGDFTVTTEKTKGTTFAKTGSTTAFSTEAGAPTDTNIAGNLITTGRVDANELGVSDKDGANSADLSVEAGEGKGVKASAGNGTTTGSLDVKADEVSSSVKDASGKGSTFKQRIDKIMMESKDVSIKAEETLTNEAKVITNKASEVINNEAVNINNTATGIITSKASEIKNQADKLISNKVGENTWENMENGKITTSIKDGAKQNLTQSNAAGTTQSTVDVGKSTVTIQNADGLVDVVTDGTNTSVQNQTASQIAADVKDGAGNENASVANATISANTIKSGSKANTVISTADGTSFINSEAAAPVTGASGAGTAVNTTIKGNTITTGKVTMDYAEVMKDLGVRGNANITGKTTTGSLEVTGTSTLKGDVTMESNATVNGNFSVGGNTNLKNTEVDGTLNVTQKATFGDSVSIAKDLSVGGDVTANSYKVGDKTYIDANGIHANDQKITNVADGSISEGSKDAVNGGQLYGVKRDLEHQVDKVGANAAAMANLRPMEFDPSSKWNIAAAIGNYGSETAAALGAFYRPNDDVMVNLSTAFGTGENMVGGGVSVRLGKGGNKLSREENNALKDQVNDLTARMDALLSVLNPNMSKDFPDVPENHWAYEAVSRLAGNDIVQGYPDGEFHGERTMTRYEMAEIIYNALSRGAEAERELVEEFKPELQAMAASEKATAEKAEG